MRSPAAAGTDFPEALPSPTSPAATPSHHPSSGRHFYLAVDRLQYKMMTLLDLLGVVSERRGALPIAVCVSSRDELDTVCAAVANLPSVSLSPLYSDQAEAERASVLEKFRQAAIQRNQTKDADIAESPKPESVASKLSIIVATDACLPLATMGEAPLMAHVLINYELPTKKEAYLRRMSACLAADGIVINMVVGGEVATLKGLEENSGLLIAEMPIHVSEIL